eukprot:UN04069
MLSCRVLPKFVFLIGSIPKYHRNVKIENVCNHRMICGIIGMAKNNKPVKALENSKFSVWNPSKIYYTKTDEEIKQIQQTFAIGQNNNLWNITINDSNYFVSEILTSNSVDTQKCLWAHPDICVMASDYGETDDLLLLMNNDHIYCLIFSDEKLEPSTGYYHIFDVTRYDFEYYNCGLYLAPYKIMIRSEMFTKAKDEFENFYDSIDDGELLNTIKQKAHIIEQGINDNEASLSHIDV